MWKNTENQSNLVSIFIMNSSCISVLSLHSSCVLSLCHACTHRWTERQKAETRWPNVQCWRFTCMNSLSFYLCYFQRVREVLWEVIQRLSSQGKRNRGWREFVKCATDDSSLPLSTLLEGPLHILTWNKVFTVLNNAGFHSMKLQQWGYCPPLTVITLAYILHPFSTSKSL